MEHGLFYGFTAMVTMLLVNQAIGGILVAVVMKYADNIMKGFAIAVSLCVTVVLNYLLLDGSPTKYFVVAAVCDVAHSVQSDFTYNLFIDYGCNFARDVSDMWHPNIY